VPTKTRRSDF